MKNRILSLALCLCMVWSLLPTGVFAAGTEDFSEENCRALSETWFGDNPSTELRLPADLVPRKSARSMAGQLDAYFDAREKSWIGYGEAQRKSAEQTCAGASFSDAIAAFADRAELTVTDARITTVYDNEHIIAHEDGSYTVFVYEWVFFDYDDLTDGVQTTDVSGCGVSHKIVLSPTGGGFIISSDEYDASDFLGICTLNESTKRELEEMNWTPAETGEDLNAPTGVGRGAEDSPARKGVFYSQYSPEAATAYADKYVYNKAQGGTVYESYYNKAYANFNSVGGDCANYTSQCINAGGMPQVKGTHTGRDGWYYNSRDDRSGTWTYVPYLRDWMAANRGVKKAASDAAVWKGSPVFYGDQHAVICVGWNSAGVPVINSHNNDWYHVKWNYYDPGNVTTVQLTPAPNSDPHPGKPVLTNFVRSWKSGQSVVFNWEDTYYTTHYNLYIDAMRPDGAWERNRQICNYAQSGQTLRLPDGIYRVILQAVNAEEEDWPYTNGDGVRFVVGSHTHSRGELIRYEPQHPHPSCYRCADCGQIWTEAGTANTVDHCSICQRPGKPVLQGPAEELANGEPVRFLWDPVSKATRYNLYFDRQNPDGTWQTDCLVKHSAESGCTARFDAGTYRVLLRAENSRCALEDGTGWAYNDAETVIFTVGQKVKITFEPAGGSFADECRTEAADRLNAGWGVDELSVFTADGETVITADDAVEVAVAASGLVTGKRLPGGTEGHLTVPDGGFVLAAGGDGIFPKTAFVKAIVPGDFVAFDRDTMTAYHYTDADGYLSQHKQVLPASVYGSLPVPEREGYYFNGWLDAKGRPVGCDTFFSSAQLTASWADDDTAPAEKRFFEGHGYARYEYSLSWHEAERFCEDRGGHLAVITSFAEQAAVEDLIRSGGNAAYFIGCSTQSPGDPWTWITGEDFSAYRNWASRSPEPADESCFGGMVNRSGGADLQFGEWMPVPDVPSYPADSPGNYGFICEFDTVSPDTHAHEFTEEVVPPDCLKEGWTIRKCACGETIVDDVTQALGHDYKEQVTAPDCTRQGFSTFTCTRCGDSFTGAETKALGHDYVSGACTRCGEKDPDDVPAPDLSELNAVVAGAFRTKLDGFTSGSVSALDEALENAAAAASSGRQKVIDDAAKAVRDAVDALEPMPQRLFRDVLDSTRFFHDPAYWALRANPRITNGVDATHFGPERPCTRAHVVTFLWRAAGCPKPKSTKTGFKDLKAGAFYEKAVAWAVENGITKGVSKTEFAPDGPCSRGQIVTFLWRFMGSGKPVSTATAFADLKPGAYYAKAVAWAVENNVTNGMSTTAFAPDAGCTRGQAVTFLYRAAKVK